MARTGKRTDRTALPGPPREPPTPEASEGQGSLIEKWQFALSAVHRLTAGVDYALAVRYEEIHVLCNVIHTDAIIDCAERCGLELDSVHSFLYHEQKGKP